MNFMRVSEKLTGESTCLTLLPLKILQPLRDTYDALFVQPCGDLQATKDGVRNADHAIANKLYLHLLVQSCEQKVDLLVTPEYCVPWSIVEEVVTTNDYRPKQGALWALGCESITLKELSAYKAKWESQGVNVLYETPQSQNKNFLCPLVYVFWVKNTDNEPNICILVQFKSVPCGKIFEVDHLYCGNDVYIFGNGTNELNFFSLICADVFEFTNDQIQNYHNNSLILHIQLNEKPWHTDFTQYRNQLFSVGSNSRVELICLNWATGVKWNNGTTWNHSPNSAFYIPKKLFQKVSDTDIDLLHKKGFYFNKVHAHWDSLFLNNTAQAILVSKQPIRFDGNQALAVPWRMKYLKCFIPNSEKDAWIEVNESNDGFMDLLAEYKPTDLLLQDGFERYEANLKNVYDISPLAVERSLELLQGPNGQSSSWYDRYELDALSVATEESPQRVTAHQEKCSSRRGVIFRKRRVQAGYDAATLYTKSLDWPIPLKNIGQGFDYHWIETYPHCNVVPLGMVDEPATLIYLDACFPNEAGSYYTKMVACLRNHTFDISSDADFNANNIRAKDRLCVVYKENHQYKILHESDGKKSIAIPANQSPTSFDKEDDNEY